MKKEIKGVLFDLDNTLIDASSTIEKADEAVLNEMKKDFKDLNKELFNEINHRVNKEFKNTPYKERNRTLFYELFGKVSGFEFKKDHLDKYSDIFEEYLFRRIEFSEGVEEVIKKLKDNGLKIGLLTGEGMYPGSKSNTIKNLPFMKNFDLTVIAMESIEESKKEVNAFIKTAKLLGLRPEEIIFIGDMPEVDIDNAKEAGMLTVLFDRYNKDKKRKEKSEPDYIIEDIKELYTALNLEK